MNEHSDASQPPFLCGTYRQERPARFWDLFDTEICELSLRQSPQPSTLTTQATAGETHYDVAWGVDENGSLNLRVSGHEENGELTSRQWSADEIRFERTYSQLSKGVWKR